MLSPEVISPPKWSKMHLGTQKRLWIPSWHIEIQMDLWFLCTSHCSEICLKIVLNNWSGWSTWKTRFTWFLLLLLVEKYQGLHDNVLMFCVFFYWAWIKLKNAPLVLVGVTSKDHWDHLNQNPRLKALEFVASKSRKVMPAQEENEDRFCPAGWKKLGWKWWKHWLSERSKYMLDVFVCFSWMKVLSIPSNFLLFFQFPCSHLKRNVGSLIQFFLHLFVTYIYAQTGTFADPTVQRFELFFPFECGVSFFFVFQEAFSSCGSSQSSASGWKHSKGWLLHIHSVAL